MRMLRFIRLFFHYIGHMWYAAKFQHVSYVVHGTNDVKKHEKATKKLGKLVAK